MSTVGQTIAGKYRVDRPIGAGGMGTVVAATHLQLGTPVALKFLSEKIKGSASSVERFTREARACAALRGEHICRVTDFGLHEGAPYIAMELLEGMDLARLLDTGKTDAGLAVDFIIQACSGLAEAHAQGIVHRDLKPGNLFLTRRPDGTPLIKVLDFGVAKIPLEDDDASLTKTSHVIGSPGYMAPEQLRSSKTVDVRADVWALGVILYELISTRHPFHASAVTEVALKIAMDEPPPLAEAPDALRVVVMRCLEKEPDDRYPDVESLAAALAPFAARDRAAGIAAAKLWIESPWLREPLPTTQPTVGQPEAPTKADSPRGKREPDTTHQVGIGEVAKPARGSRRIAVIATTGTLALAGLTVFALTRGGNGTVIEDATDSVVVTRLDVPTPRPPVDASTERRGVLEVSIANFGIATVLVDGKARGTGSRIMVDVPYGGHSVVIRDGEREASRDVMIASDTTQIVMVLPPAVVPPRKPRVTPTPTPPDHDIFSSRGSAKTTPTPTPTPPASDFENPFKNGSGSQDERTRAEQRVTNATQVLRDRSLRIDDLGPIGIALQNNITNGQRAKNWALVFDAAGKLAGLATTIKIDRAFISTKSARVSARLAQMQPSEDLRAKIVKLQSEATALAATSPAIANQKLNIALDMLPPPMGRTVDPKFLK